MRYYTIESARQKGINDMEFQHEKGRIALYNEAGTTIAEVTFPPIGDTLVNLNHTFVDGSLRGQGVAGKLMQEAAAQLRREHKKAILTCSYAQQWFEKHPEYDDVVQR